jgi:hypothetical protein
MSAADAMEVAATTASADTAMALRVETRMGAPLKRIFD